MKTKAANKRRVVVRGATVRQWREERGWVTRQAAKSLGMSLSTYQYLEEHGAPLVHALAMGAVSAGVPPYLGPNGGFQDVSVEEDQ